MMLIYWRQCRYIHYNPEKAVICCHTEYQWSSYRFYIEDSNVLPETKVILQIFSDNITVARQQFLEFSKEISADNFLDVTLLSITEINAENIETFIARFLAENGLNSSELLNSKELIKLLIAQITKKSNLSLRKIATFIGINRETIRKLSKNRPPDTVYLIAFLRMFE